MTLALRCALLCSALCLVSRSALAQEIVGELVDEETGLAIDGVFIMAVDSAGVARAGALTDADGRFRILLPSSGVYTLSTQRIGYRTTTSPELRVSPGQTLPYRMEVATEAIVLENLSVSAERRCSLMEGAGVTLTRLWDEAQKAMTVAEWTRDVGVVEMLIEDFERSIDLEGEVRTETRTARDYYGSRPYHSLPAEQLASQGYVVERGDGTFYFAPDESVLLSRSFLESHCFQPRRDPDKPGLIGLAFEPIQGRTQPDIRGAFWLDEQSAELRFVDYRYSSLLQRVSAPDAGGRVEFQRLENGAWIVSRWWIRMPRFAVVNPSGQRGAERVAVIDYSEEGGQVLSTVDASEIRRRERAVMEGRVEHRDTGEPLVGAVVFLSGTQYRGVTDANGFYRLEDVRPGTYPLVYRHAALDSLGTFAWPVEVELQAGEVLTTTLYFPPGEARR